MVEKVTHWQYWWKNLLKGRSVGTLSRTPEKKIKVDQEGRNCEPGNWA